MGRKLLILAVFAGLITIAIACSTELRQAVDNQFYKLALLTKTRL